MKSKALILRKKVSSGKSNVEAISYSTSGM